MGCKRCGCQRSAEAVAMTVSAPSGTSHGIGFDFTGNSHGNPFSKINCHLAGAQACQNGNLGVRFLFPEIGAPLFN